MMNISKLGVLLLALAVTLASCSEKKNKHALLYASRKVNSAAATEALKNLSQIASRQKISLDTTTNVAYLQEDSLKKYGALIVIDLPIDAFEVRQQNDIERYVQAGGGLMMVHSNRTTKYQWPWLNELIGATAQQDSATSKSQALVVKDDSHESTKDLPETWNLNDELIAYSMPGEKMKVLVSSGSSPVSWISNDSDTRFFFTSVGGTKGVFSDENFNNHILGGINYVLNGNALDYKKATSKRLPEANRFLELVLDTYLDEPIEMEILPDGKVIFIERHGRVKLYDPAKKASRVVGELAVQLEGNYEDGLLGLELDPAFEKNKYIYLYYSPLGGEPEQRLSRFRFEGDSLIKSSEKIVMKVPVQRETCCHSAGNVYFAPDGHLYLSTGDNTSSKESDGFTPIDERPGRGPFDAQKSSGNTHDLRGKILRIHVEEDGSYTIPDGNLFPKDGTQGRPEIYVMGARNPYRITVDHRGFLYWGDVGPDGGEDSERGPRSHDEWNQARKPGFFGWPYFVADNKAYADFDFATNTIGPRFDPKNVMNESPYNYGSKKLPPAQPAMIYYPYNQSSEFPMLSTGSRSAMAGPFYYADQHKDSQYKLPDYYHEKMFIFEWARNWIKVLTFSPEGDLRQIESFMPSREFWHPIDVKFGKDGAMYVLQYGSNYFARNPDAQLLRIEYAEGNRQPVAQIIADKTVGASPLTVHVSAKESFDYDPDAKLTYSWDSGNGQKSTEAEADFSYDKPGVYNATLTVTDESGSSATTQVEIKAGNEAPEVNIKLAENTSFYFDNSALTYSVDVLDKEDGTLASGIETSQVKFAVDYIREGKDLALLTSYGSSAVSAKFIKGKSLMDASDCKSCHALDKKSIGPTWIDVAKRYHGQAGAIPMLVGKIIKGGNGNWGHTMMAAHPQLSEADTRQMVDYILSLADEQAGLPLKGIYKLKDHAGKGEAGSYVISASYTDKGHEVTGPLTGRQMLILRHPKVQAENFDSFRNVGQQRPVNGDLAYVSDIKDGSYISFRDIDLKNINAVVFNVQANEGKIEIHQGSPDGILLGTVDLSGKTSEENPWRTVSTSIKDPGGRNELFFVFKNEAKKNRNFAGLDWIEFKRK